MDPFAVPATTRIAMWVGGVGKTNRDVRATAMISGSKKATAPPMVSQDLVSAPTMSTDAALPPFAKEINITDSACKHLHGDDDDVRYINH